MHFASSPARSLLRLLQVYVGKLGNAYMYESEVAGQTDFFYGFGTCWITDSLVSLRGCGGGITAWKGTNTTFENKYGIYIHDSVVQKANSSLAIEGQCALGRPWNPQHRSIFANCYLDDSIRASGYIQWSTADPRVNQSKFFIEEGFRFDTLTLECDAYRHVHGRIPRFRSRLRCCWQGGRVECFHTAY